MTSFSVLHTCFALAFWDVFEIRIITAMMTRATSGSKLSTYHLSTPASLILILPRIRWRIKRKS